MTKKEKQEQAKIDALTEQAPLTEDRALIEMLFLNDQSGGVKTLKVKNHD
jgi:hypothetical protein